MSNDNANLRDTIICSIIWIECAIALIFIALQAGWKTAVAASLPLIFFTDLVIWIAYSLVQLPCGFTEWVCYPFWPFNYHGSHMRWGVIIRLVEIITLFIVGHWLCTLISSAV